MPACTRLRILSLAGAAACRVQVAEEVVDASVLNAGQAGLGLAEGARVARSGARVSLTVRRVTKVLKGLAVGRGAAH